MAQPCCGSSARVFRISRSSVPCGSSMRWLANASPYHFYRRECNASPVEAQEERSGEGRGGGPPRGSRAAGWWRRERGRKNVLDVIILFGIASCFVMQPSSQLGRRITLRLGFVRVVVFTGASGGGC